MFNGKVYIYHNHNGEKKKIEKEFTNEDRYKKFLAHQGIHESMYKSEHHGYHPIINQWDLLYNQMEKLLDQKLIPLHKNVAHKNNISSMPAKYDVEDERTQESSIDFDAYETQLYERRQQEKKDREIIEKTQKLKIHKGDLKKLEQYKSEFVAMGKKPRDRFMKRLEKDIQQVQKAIKTLQKELQTE